MCDFCTILVVVRFLPGQTVEEIKQAIVKVLDGIANKDPEFRYEIEIPPGKPFKGMANPMSSMEVPLDQPIIQIIQRNYELVTGKKISKVGVDIPHAYVANDGSRPG